MLLGACFVGFSAFESAWGPLADALAVNAVRDHVRDYGRIRLLASGGFAVTVAAAGFLYDRTGYGPTLRPLPGPVAGPCGVGGLRPGHRPGRPRGDRRAGRSRARTVRREAARSRSPSGCSPGCAQSCSRPCSPTSGVMAGFTYLPLRIVDLGGQPSDVALAAAVAAFAEIPAMLVAGAVAARIGLRGLFALSSCLYAACFASWVVIDVPALHHRQPRLHRHRLRRAWASPRS